MGCLDTTNYRRKKRKVRSRIDWDVQNTSVKIQDLSPKSDVDIWAFVRKTCEIRVATFDHLFSV